MAEEKKLSFSFFLQQSAIKLDYLVAIWYISHLKQK